MTEEPAARRVLDVWHSRPDFAVPPGSWDCHTHLFGPAEWFPLAAERIYTPSPAGLSDLVALHDWLGIDRAVLVQPSAYGADNSCLVTALRALRGRGRGVVVIDEDTTATELDVMSEVGVRGARINLVTAGEGSLDRARDLLAWTAARIASLGWHLEFFVSGTALVNLFDALGDCPVPIVLDHFAGVRPGVAEERRALIELVGSGKAYVKLSAPHRISDGPDHADAAALARHLFEANPDRVIWGTDWPHPGVPPGTPRSRDVTERFRTIDDGRGLAAAWSWAGDADAGRRLLVDNPSRLYA